MSAVEPLGAAARLGLRIDDVIEQANGWPTRDCGGYAKAVADARRGDKALLVLVVRDGKRRALAFEAGVWVEPQEERRQAVVSLKSLLEAPLPEAVRGSVRSAGDEAIEILRRLEASAKLPGRLRVYDSEVEQAGERLTALDHGAQGEAEKRLVAGAREILRYYAVARDVWLYKFEQLAQTRPDLRRRGQALYNSASFPYFLDSPVLGWVDRYPFLKESLATTPRRDALMERPGDWNPDQAILLLWQKAQEDADYLSRWLSRESG